MSLKFIRTLDSQVPWQVRCVSCGITKRSGEAGQIRISSRRVIGNRTLGFCRKCSGFKWLVVEAVAPPAAPPAKNRQSKRPA